MDLLTLFSSTIRIISISHVNNYYTNKLTHFGMRKVEYYELDYIINGEGFIITDGIKYIAQKGCLFFRSPGMYVDGYLPYTCYLVRFEIVDPPKSETVTSPNFSLPHHMHLTNTQALEKWFYNLYDEYIFQNEFSSYLQKLYLNNIFNEIYTHLKLSTMAHCSYPTIEDTIHYIEKYYYKNISLETLSSISSYSKYTFCRHFKKVTGYTPVTYINQYRINHAKKLLVETNLPIKEILTACGFNNETHFYNLFKNTTNLTPNDYRQLNSIWHTFP